MVTFTELSILSFSVQLFISAMVTAYLYNKYRKSWFKFEVFFFLFFLAITLSNILAFFFITSNQTELPYNLINSISLLSIVLLMIASFLLLGLENKIILYLIPGFMWVIDLLNSVIHVIDGGTESIITNTTYRAISGILELLIIIPPLLIFVYIALRTKNVSLSFFSLGLVFYLIGGLTVSSIGEVSMAIFFTLALLSFTVATIIPLLQQNFPKETKDAVSS